MAGSPGRTCPVCGQALVMPATGRRPRYCSDRCRQAAHRARRREERALERAAEHQAELIVQASWLRWHTSELAHRIAGLASPGPQAGIAELAQVAGVTAARIAAVAAEYDQAVREHQQARQILGDAPPNAAPEAAQPGGNESFRR